MTDSEKTREGRARRSLAKSGLCLRKTPSRSSPRKYHGAGYMIINAYRNEVVLGGSQRAYQATLDDVESFAFRRILSAGD